MNMFSNRILMAPGKMLDEQRYIEDSACWKMPPPIENCNQDVQHGFSQFRKVRESLSLHAQEISAIRIALAEQPREREVQTALLA